MTLDQFLSTLVIFGAIQGVLLILALQRIRNKNRDANRILSIFLLLVTGTLAMRNLGEIYQRFPELLLLQDVIIFLYGPIFYLYIKKLLFRTEYSFKKIWRHFVPAGIHMILMSVIYVLFQDKLYDYTAGAESAVLWEIVAGLAILQNFSYIAFGGASLYRYHKSLYDEISCDRVPMHLYIIMFCFFVCISSWSYSYMMDHYLGVATSAGFDYTAVWIFLSTITYSTGYFAITRPEYFKVPTSATRSVKKIETIIPSHLKDELHQLMLDRKPHLDPQITLQQIADLLGKNRNLVSHAINSEFHMNFFDFINSYRVAEFKGMISVDKHEHRTLLALAYEAGFNSKTTFNSAFKKLTDMTPRDYLKSISKTL